MAEPTAELALLIRLLAAAVLAAVLGWEREAARKPAGLRTHMLVGVASALFTVLGSWRSRLPAEGGLRADPRSTVILMLVLRTMARFDRKN